MHVKFVGISKCTFYMLVTCRNASKSIMYVFFHNRILKNVSRKVYIVNFTNGTRNSLKMSLFPGDLEGAKPIKNTKR